MRVFNNPEFKGVLALIGITLVIGCVFMALTGKLTEWFGIRLTLKQPISDKIVFVSDRNGHPDIWIMNPDGSGQKALTNDEYEDSDPVISPDGYQIVFISKRDTKYAQLYAMDVDGTHIHRITDITGFKSSPKFSQDGKEIIFLCAGDVWKIDFLGERPHKVLPTETQSVTGGERAPYIWAGQSSNGKTIAAVQSTDDGQAAFWMPSEAEAPKPVSDPQFGNAPLAGDQVSAAWARDEEKMAICLITPKWGMLAVADASGETVQPLLKGNVSNPCWSPDGTALAVEDLKRTGSGEYEPIGLSVADMSAQTVKLLVKGEATDPVWSPDGGNILYIRGGDIYSLDVQSEESTNLTGGKGSNTSPSWAPASK